MCREAVASIKQISAKYKERVAEMLCLYCQNVYNSISIAPASLDLTAIVSIEELLKNAAVAILANVDEYTAALDQPDGESPSVYILKGHQIIQQFEECRNEHAADIESEKNQLKATPNWPYPCKHCNVKAVFFDSYCGRSLDECMILTFTCLNCKRSWTI